MKPCISEATTMPGTFAEDVAAFADAGFTGMEVWLTKLEQHVEAHSVAATRRLLEDRNMALAAASYQGGLLLSQGGNARPTTITFAAGWIFAISSTSRRSWSSPILRKRSIRLPLAVPLSP